MIVNESLINRFIKYVKIDTQSSEDSTAQPSSEKERDLAVVLVNDLKELGVQVDYDEKHCYVYGYLPANNSDKRGLGFISHMDTSPECSDTNVKPRIIENFDGRDELLSTEDFPELLNHIGGDLIATDGTTLLGADDKAGIAEIMYMLEFFNKNPDVNHRPIAIAFTPDEEIGRGTENFDINRFKASQAYTVDGGKLGIVEYECFNAASAKIVIKGRSVHPGSAKNTMINASKIAMELDSMLPPMQVPEHTEGYEGFYHLCSIKGTVELAEMTYIIRDHDHNIFNDRKKNLREIVNQLNDKYGQPLIEIEFKDQYSNMADVIKNNMELVERPLNILKEMGVNVCSLPIRGGTDGASLSFMGIPCPNLCTGGYNYHSRYEYASIQEMEKTAQLLIELAK